MFNKLWNLIRDKGTLNEAKSSWGADRWEFAGRGVWVAVTLEDEGYTQGIFSDKVNCRTTAGNAIKFELGGNKDLEELYLTVNKCTCPSVACELHGAPPGSTSGGW